jgi:hypothetical protein
LAVHKNTIATEEADTGSAPRKADQKRKELSPAAQRELDAFEVVSRKSRRAVAGTIKQLVRPA